jgi:spore coat polysaccharide biosynthesis protein SpsF
MSSTIGLVDVSATNAPVDGGPSASLPAKRLGNRSILEWVVRRVTDAQTLSTVVVVADYRDPRRQLIDAITPADVPVFFGKQSDALGRLAAAAKKFSAEAVVRVRVDHPFVDPVLIDRLVREAQLDPTFEYISYGNSRNCATLASRTGLFAEWCRSDALARANRDATDAQDRQDAMRYVRTHPQLFQTRILPAPEALDRDDLRLAVVSEEDLDHAQTIYDALGPESLDWQQIARLLNHQPQIRHRMALLNRSDAV